MDRTAALCQLGFAVTEIGHVAEGPSLVPYQPEPPSGADRPADDTYLTEVRARPRARPSSHYGQFLLLNGRPASQSLFIDLWPTVDSVFSGRPAHDLRALDAISEEVEHVRISAPNSRLAVDYALTGG